MCAANTVQKNMTKAATRVLTTPEDFPCPDSMPQKTWLSAIPNSSICLAHAPLSR
jgi:hypothetical protein